MRPLGRLSPRLAAALLAATLAGGGSSARAEPCEVDAGASTVTGQDGYASLTLADGREVRLADIVPAEATGLRPESNALVSIVDTEVTVVQVADGPDGGDRYGRVLGDVASKATGERLSRRLLREGLALVNPADMSGPCLDALFAAEREAEGTRRGIWASDGLVNSAGDPDLAAEAGRYLLVRGVVKSVGETRGTIYLNFGADYRTDFTGLVNREDAKGWADTLKALAGRNVRIRGVLEAWNGGLIRVEHLRQIELLSEDRPG